MEYERGFLVAILNQDADFDYDVWRKVYADWLDEHESPVKAAFLRADDPKVQQEEAAKIDDTIWLATVSNPKIESCGRFDPEEQERSERWWAWVSRPYGPNGRSRSHHENSLEEWQKNHPNFRFDFICDKTWKDMKPTGDPTVRNCESCKENVYFCDNIMDVRDHAHNGHCVAVDLGVIRREDDTVSEFAIFGRPSKEHLAAEDARQLPDAVSAARLKGKGERTFLYLFDDHRGNRAYLFSKSGHNEAWRELERYYQGDYEQLRMQGIYRKILALEDVPHEEDYNVKPYPGQHVTVKDWVTFPEKVYAADTATLHDA